MTTLHALKSSSSVRRMTSLSVALLTAVGMLAVPTALPAAANGDPIYSVSDPTGGDGSTEAQAIVHNITVDCSRFPDEIPGEWEASDGVLWNRMGEFNGTFEEDKWYTLRLTVATVPTAFVTQGGDALVGCEGIQFFTSGDLAPAVNTSYSYVQFTASGNGTVLQQTFQMTLESDDEFASGNARFQVTWADWTSGSREFMGVYFMANANRMSDEPPAPRPCPPDICPPQNPSQGSSPTETAVSVAAEQGAAAGVAGSSGAVRVRGGAPVPVTSTVVPSVGPRGGVVIEGDGTRVAVASTLGATSGSGVRAPSGGLVDVSVSGPLTPGAVIEVWVRSEPRLVAAAAVPADFEAGDAVAFTVPLATPLDGGAAVEDGEHTLELRMYTADGFEVIATGLTVGSIAPTSIPAGEGPAPLGGMLGGLIVLLGAVALGLRVSMGRRARGITGVLAG